MFKEEIPSIFPQEDIYKKRANNYGTSFWVYAIIAGIVYYYLGKWALIPGVAAIVSVFMCLFYSYKCHKLYS